MTHGSIISNLTHPDQSKKWETKKRSLDPVRLYMEPEAHSD